MKTVQEIYEKYRIIPGLQMHQLRVAAVAKIVCDNAQKHIDTRSAVLACLFHDMGNIIKADLAVFPEFLEPQGFDYWESVKEEFSERYGSNAHEANVAIAREIGLPDRVVEIIDGISFSKIPSIVEGNDMEQKVCEYADDRVGPHGVLSIANRLAEARSRYVDSGKTYYTAEGFEKLSAFVFTLEEQIFAEAHIKPEDITDSSVAPIIEELRNYIVS